jgi:crossover junction endodeoxyribonuclease RuvC
MRVLGVDPGLTRCGFGVVDGGLGRSVTAVDVGVVRTPAELDVAARLLALADGAERWFDVHSPEVVAIERVFSQHNVRTAMGTAQAGAVVALAAARRGIPVRFHTPSEVKAAVTGSGVAGKSQVTAMVMRILALEEKPTPADAADALALAICQCWRGPMLARIEAAQAAGEAAKKAQLAKLAAARAAASSRAAALSKVVGKVPR